MKTTTRSNSLPFAQLLLALEHSDLDLRSRRASIRLASILDQRVHGPWFATELARQLGSGDLRAVLVRLVANGLDELSRDTSIRGAERQECGLPVDVLAQLMEATAILLRHPLAAGAI